MQSNFGLVSRSALVRKEISPYLKLSMFNPINASFGLLGLQKYNLEPLSTLEHEFLTCFFFFALNADSKTGKNRLWVCRNE